MKKVSFKTSAFKNPPSKASSYYSVAEVSQSKPVMSAYQKKANKLIAHLSKDENIIDVSKRINAFHHVNQLLDEGFETDISQA